MFRRRNGVRKGGDPSDISGCLPVQGGGLLAHLPDSQEGDLRAGLTLELTQVLTAAQGDFLLLSSWQ